jgi:hypothetical protein
MSYVLAVVLTLIAAWLWRDGNGHMKIAKAEEERIEALKREGIKADTGPALHPSLAGLVLVAPAITSLITISFAGILVIAWLVVGRGSWFTVVDLGGLLLAVAAYVYWINARTKLRQVQLDVSTLR